MIEESITDICGAVGVERYFAAAAKIDVAHHQCSAVSVLKMGTFYADHLSTPCAKPIFNELWLFYPLAGQRDQTEWPGNSNADANILKKGRFFCVIVLISLV